MILQIISTTIIVALVVVTTLMFTYRKMWKNARAVNTELIIRLTEKCGDEAVRDIMFKKRETEMR